MPKKIDGLTPARVHGSPCKRCGGTLRHKVSRNCVNCKRPYDRVAKMPSERVERKAAWNYARRQRLMDAGLCTNCGEPRLSDWYCWNCLNRMETGRVARQAQSKGIDTNAVTI